MPKPIRSLDLMFLLGERATEPKHVALLLLLQMPTKASTDLVTRLVQSYREAVPRAPFNRLARFGLTHLPQWTSTRTFDGRYHVRHTVLRAGATPVQLLAHVAKSHQQLLDRDHPLFQAEFIEGLRGRRFALYLKMHHALVDGASGIMRVLASLGETADASLPPPFFAADVGSDAPASPRTWAATAARLNELAMEQLAAGRDFSLGVLRGRRAPDAREGPGSVPFTAPRTPMNAPLQPPRSLALLSLPLDAMQAAGRAFGGTLNDVAVTVVDAALNRYLARHGAAPTEPLVAMCPVSLRDAGDREATTKVSAIFIALGTPPMTIGARMQHVIAAAGRAKDEVRRMSKDAATMYAGAVFTVAGLVDLTHAGSLVRPVANLVLSNVPGSRTERYLGPAKVLGMYPLSALGAGIGLNVTLLSRAGSMDFGFVANGVSMPDLGELADDTRAAFADLRRAALKPLAIRP